MELELLDHGSTSVTLAWPPVQGATAYDVIVSPEPPVDETGELQLGVHEATLDATATSYTLDDLAASTHVFVRVDAKSGSERLAWGSVHAFTRGGQRALLDTPLREVHGFAPRVLMLVLSNPHTEYRGGRLQGDLGGAWQGGDWKVERADGTVIDVARVHRHTIPVSQPDYPVGYDQYGDGDVVNIDHRIFLELAQPVGNLELLTVEHDGDAGTELRVRVPFSDRYLETPLIQVNQVGYNPRATSRWAYVSGWMGSGGAVDLSELSGKAELLVEPVDSMAARRVSQELSLSVRKEFCEFAGSEVRQIDLSEVPAAEGVRMRVRIPGVGVSWPTAVSEAAASKAFYVVWRGLFHNRWCGDLDPAYTDWSRPADHCSAYFINAGKDGTQGMFGRDTPTRESDLRELRGGHHDAGDFDIRPYHVVVAQYLLRAYEVAPESFADGQLTVPESGNGIPDVLDEALWNIAAWQQLQNEDGGVRSGVESFRHPAGIYYADQDALPYWTYDPVPWHTAYVAALFAQAAHLVEPFDSSRAAELRTDAEAAYAYASRSGAPEEYLLYAAGELYRLTRDEAFRQQFEQLWETVGNWGGGAFESMQGAASIYPGSFTRHTPAMPDFVMAYATAGEADTELLTKIEDELTERADQATSRVLDSQCAHRHGRDMSRPPDWGVDVGTGRDGDFIYQRLQLGNLDEQQAQDYIDALSLSADYVLGCNPAGYSFITGLGSRSPQEPLHLDSLAFIKDRDMPPMPGIPTYGLVRGFPGSYYYDAIESGYFPAFNNQPEGHHLTDTRAAVNMSEFSVWELQAPMAELFAALLGPDMQPPEHWKPGGSGHRLPVLLPLAE